VFPSQEFRQSLTDAVKRLSHVNAEIEKNSRMLRISKEKEHRESAELRGEDPNRITKDLDLSLKQKERETQLIKQELQGSFSAAKEHFKDVNHRVQTNIYSAIVEPRNTRLRGVELAVEGAISELLAIVSSAQFGDDPRVTVALDHDAHVYWCAWSGGSVPLHSGIQEGDGFQLGIIASDHGPRVVPT
jgi:hypothetical protein